MKINLETIRAAQRGESESMAELTTSANRQVFTYIYRLTLDYHLSQDLAQETVLQLIESLPELDFAHTNLFWSWVYRTALGKVQHHFRIQGNKRVQLKTFADIDKFGQSLGGFDSGINKLIKEEMRKTVFDAMQSLRFRYRNILTLRCFNNLSYAEIAAISGGSELQARLLFFRAKQSLQRQLTNKGLKKEHFLSALGFFGLLTAGVTDNAAAATSVSATSLTVAPTTTIIGALTSKTVVTAIVSIFAVTAVTNAVKQYNRYRIPPYEPPAYSNIDPNIPPFADLYYLLESGEFSDPVQITGSYDPDRDGFRVIDSTAQQEQPFISTLEKALLNDPNDKFRVILSRDHWVEMIFDGPIVDGPGADIFFAGWNCRTVRAVLIGEQGQSYTLPILNCLPDCPRRCHCLQIAPFDLSKHKIDFTPVKVQIQGIYGTTPFGGFQLSMVRARIAKANIDETAPVNNEKKDIPGV
jgi:RNA polymerase sigma-70 factor (ECF subfamily)